MNLYTTIQVSKLQADQLKQLRRYPNEPIRAVIQRFLDEKFQPQNVHVHKWRKLLSGEAECKKCNAIGVWSEELRDWVEKTLPLDGYTQ